MTTSTFDHIAHGWLAEGPTELSDRVLQSALDEIHLTHQRRSLRASWRTMLMSGFARAAIVAIFVMVAGGSIYLLGLTAAGGPRATPVEPTPTPSAVKDGPAGFDLIHVSAMYGYGIRYPGTWNLSAGTNANAADYIPEVGEARGDFYGDTMSGHGLLITAGPVSATRKDLATWSAFVAGAVPRKFGDYLDIANCIQSGRTLLLDGEPANELDFFCPQHDFLWVTAIHGGRAYQVVWLDDGGFDANALRPLLDKFLSSFTFTS